MRNISKALFLSLFVAALFVSNPAKSQGFSLNLGAAYGFDVEEVGARVGASYFLNNKMRIGADVTYWLIPSVDDLEFRKKSSILETTMLEFNGHFHYFLLNSNGLGLYGIGVAGLHYIKSSFIGIEMSNSEIGVGLGAGVEYNLGSVRIFAEPKYFFTGFDQFKVTGGIRFSFGGN